MLRLSNKKFFAFIFLSLFLSLMASGLHQLSHECEEDQQKCELCEVVMQNELEGVVLSPQIEICTVHEVHSTFLIPYEDLPLDFTNTNSFKCRPPPATT